MLERLNPNVVADEADSIALLLPTFCTVVCLDITNNLNQIIPNRGV